MIAAVEAALRRPHAEALLPRLAEVGVPAGKVRTLDEVYDWDQTRSQGLLVDVDHPTLGPRRSCPGRRCASTTTPTPAAATTHLPPPLLGEHDDVRPRLARLARLTRRTDPPD